MTTDADGLRHREAGPFIELEVLSQLQVFPGWVRSAMCRIELGGPNMLVRPRVGGSFLTDDRMARFAMAEAASTKALSLAPDFASAHLALGAVHILTNRATEGITDCEQALTLDRNLPDAHACIGWAKYLLGCGAEPRPISTRRSGCRLTILVPSAG